MVWFFAYDDNVNPKILEARIGKWKSCNKGFVEGFSLSFDSQGFASAVERVNQKLFGVLYELSEKQLNDLDRYEGAPVVFVRRNVFVNSKGKIFEATAFFHKNHTTSKLPTEEYAKTIVEGFELQEFDKKTIDLVKLRSGLTHSAKKI